ncbi:MAG TPA: transporter [Terriglobales bacterium]|nr:transporter [Terriglobales bacterium]
MLNVISEQNLTSAHLKHNRPDMQNNAVVHILKRYGRHIFLRNVAFIVLLAFAIGGYAQNQQTSVANPRPDNQPDEQAGSVAVVEKQPAAAASSNAPDQPQSAAGLSKEIGNPLSNLWLLQTQQNNTLVGLPLGMGTYVQSNLQFMPLVPIRVSPHWNLISRPVIPIFSSQPFPAVSSIAGGTPDAHIHRTTGFGDMIVATALSPDKSLVGNWLVAAGPTFVFPTATQHALGQDTWQAGPAVALGYTGKKWLAFTFPQHWWKIGGDGKKTSQTLVQYSFSWNFDSGWSVGSSPNFTVDWEAPRDQRVTFPVGLQVGKLLHAGPMPVKVEVQPMYYAVRPTQASGAPSPKWGFQLQLTPVMPALIHGYKPS